MLFAPLEGWRHFEVTDRHTAVDYAHVLKDLAAEAYCAATPTECVPFFGTAVSSITNTASLPPTSRSA